jgi:two-component system cell cycle response regulator
MRIVLVDPQQEEVASLLEARGHEVFWFADAGEALPRIAADPNIDALVTMAEAGSMSGMELCWETRLLTGRQRAMYILLMSPTGDEITKVEAMDGGADDVMDKPPRPTELYAKLRVAERTLALQRKLMRSATTDPLSGVLNRGAFFEEATEACHEASNGRSLTVILIDVDRLKVINDRYGHDVGDRAIRAVASVLQRSRALVGRLGGDELAILLRDHMLPQALELAASLQQDLAELKLDTLDGSTGLTCSFGVSEFQPGDTVDELMKRADIALYRAKAEGRNCVAPTPTIPSISKRLHQDGHFRARPRPSPEVRERRRGLAACDGLLARVCAVVDLLVASGLTEEIAAQTLAQRMVSAGIPFPGNARCEGWGDYILAWRAAFRDGVTSDRALEEYCNVVAAIDSIPPQDRVDCVLENDLWNRRRLILRCRPVSGAPLH